jgi:hypothetical protein
MKSKTNPKIASPRPLKVPLLEKTKAISALNDVGLICVIVQIFKQLTVQIGHMRGNCISGLTVLCRLEDEFR